MPTSDLAVPTDRSQEPPSVEALRILVVEDMEADFELLVATLARQELHCVCKRVETEVALRVALREHHWDAIVSDHHLPGFSSDDALRVQRELAPDLPFIIVSGMIGEDAAVAAMRTGADDYLVKGRLARLSTALTNAINAARSRASRRAAERALARSQQELRALSNHLLKAVELERSAVARDIHDEIGSGLTTLKFDLAFIERHGTPQVAARAAESSSQVAALMDACQRLIKELRPPVLDAGLEPALRWLVRRFADRTGIATHLQCHQRRAQIPSALELVCYRTLQEALNNVAKHAQAANVEISLVIGEHDLSLEVADDGIGVKPEQLNKPDSFGLNGLQERIRQVDGWMEFAATGKGSTLIMSLPIVGDENPDEPDLP